MLPARNATIQTGCEGHVTQPGADFFWLASSLPPATHLSFIRLYIIGTNIFTPSASSPATNKQHGRANSWNCSTAAQFNYCLSLFVHKEENGHGQSLRYRKNRPLNEVPFAITASTPPPSQNIRKGFRHNNHPQHLPKPPAVLDTSTASHAVPPCHTPNEYLKNQLFLT